MQGTVRFSLAVVAAAVLTACPSKPEATKAQPAKAGVSRADKAGPDEAKKPGKAAADPHGGMMKPSAAKPANPHAAMANPHGAPKAKEPGPPRDVTPSGETTTETIKELTFDIPKEWEKGTPTSPMRLAQYVLPGPGGDAELVVFRFPGGGGGVEQNIARWKGQFQAPEGKTLDDISTTKKIDSGGLKTTLVDVSGRYVAAVRPGAAEKQDKPDTRMLGAIVEGTGDPFFLKCLGPKKTLDVWAEAYEKMLGTFKASS